MYKTVFMQAVDDIEYLIFLYVISESDNTLHLVTVKTSMMELSSLINLAVFISETVSTPFLKLSTSTNLLLGCANIRGLRDVQGSSALIYSYWLCQIVEFISALSSKICHMSLLCHYPKMNSFWIEL